MSPAPIAPDRWRKIEEVFYAALDVDPTRRGAFLLLACAGDESLRLEVESLLASDYPESPVIAGIIDNAAARLFEEDRPDEDNP